MSAFSLYDYQIDAVKKMKNGCILCGGVGTGKSRTALAYYYLRNGGEFDYFGDYIPMDDPPKDLYIITTARKRDLKEWELEMTPILVSPKDNVNLYSNKVVVDSWNNIGKYVDVRDSFFIFDEQRVVGKGAWVKSFLSITKNNEWILLSATPGDTWQDYIPVFIANGFYKNRSHFNREHVVYKNFYNTPYPVIDRYLNTGRLLRYRNDILVDMETMKKTKQNHEIVNVKYDLKKYKEIIKTRWNPITNEPIQTANEFCSLLRRVVNTDVSRIEAVLTLQEIHKRVIIFYNYNYELDLLKDIYFGSDVEVAEWNGHKHQPVPNSEKWVYLVQYNAGAEGWNCITTDTIIFFSQNYSYKIMTQAAGRIDRVNTPYKELYYYHLKSTSSIDLAITKALREKKDFNERKFYGG